MPVTTPPKSLLSIQLGKSTLNEHRISLSIMMPHIFHLPFKIATITSYKSCSSDFRAPFHATLTGAGKNLSWRNRVGGWTCCSSRSLSTQIILWVVSLSFFCISELGTSYSHVSHDSLFTYRSCCYKYYFASTFCASWKHNYFAFFIACCFCCFLCYTFLFIHFSSSQPSWGQISLKIHLPVCRCIFCLHC